MIGWALFIIILAIISKPARETLGWLSIVVGALALSGPLFITGVVLLLLS